MLSRGVEHFAGRDALGLDAVSLESFSTYQRRYAVDLEADEVKARVVDSRIPGCDDRVRPRP